MRFVAVVKEQRRLVLAQANWPAISSLFNARRSAMNYTRIVRVQLV
jgi:hypothetical protein